MTPRFVVRGLRASIGATEVLRGVDLEVGAGEVHAIMGPNGSGKSTLAHALAGRPGPVVTAGSVTIDGTELLELPAHERARHGLFVGLQQPVEVPGVSPRAALSHAGVAPQDVDARLAWAGPAAGLRADVLERPLNVDLSGGERKRSEVVQLCVLRRPVAVLDEVDSGLDVDSLQEIGRLLTHAVQEWGLSVVAITHFPRILEVLHPTRVHAFLAGRIVATGGDELGARIAEDGYAGLRPDAGAEA